MAIEPCRPNGDANLGRFSGCASAERRGHVSHAGADALAACAKYMYRMFYTV